MLVVDGFKVKGSMPGLTSTLDVDSGLGRFRQGNINVCLLMRGAGLIICLN